MENNIIRHLKNFKTGKNENLSRELLTEILASNDADVFKSLRDSANSVRQKNVGNKVYYRGLVEISNICMKNCYYCGLRKDNKEISRYTMNIEDLKEAFRIADVSRMGSLVIQSGELLTEKFYDYIAEILTMLKNEFEGKFRVTLSLGELPYEILKEFFRLGAQRYLLRIETSNENLYKKLHPQNPLHSYTKRLNCLADLQKIGYQTGTGVMIGLPYQKYEDMAEDLLFMKKIDIDMVGMGPYIEHEQTPLAKAPNAYSREERLALSYKMIALLRLLLPDINIASTTALQTLDPLGREKGVLCGANVIMPNISPTKYRDKYLLYEGKPCVQDRPDHCADCLEKKLKDFNFEVAFDEYGDSLHYKKRTGQ